MFLIVISVPCIFYRYETNTLSYDEFATLSISSEIQEDSNARDQIAMEHEVSKRSEESIKVPKFIMFYYSTTELKIETKELLLNFPNFLSAVGGNLGMFIGFSFLGFFSAFYDLMKLLFFN